MHQHPGRATGTHLGSCQGSEGISAGTTWQMLVSNGDCMLQCHVLALVALALHGRCWSPFGRKGHIAQAMGCCHCNPVLSGVTRLRCSFRRRVKVFCMLRQKARWHAPSLKLAPTTSVGMPKSSRKVPSLPSEKRWLASNANLTLFLTDWQYQAIKPTGKDAFEANHRVPWYW